jgi:Spy/CpxP family protein refolding chaperone
MKKLNAIYMAALALVLPAGSALAQTAPDNNPPQQQQGPPQGRPDPAIFQQQMLEDMKQRLAMSDPEFAAVQPEIEKIMQLQREANFRVMRGFGGPGGPGGPGGGGPGGNGDPNANGGQGGPGAFGGPGGGGPGGDPNANGGPGGPGGFGGPPPFDQTPSDVQQKADKLRQVMGDTGASSQEIKSALDDLRDAKAKAIENLTKARQELIQVLTSHQEAVLVSMNILE